MFAYPLLGSSGHVHNIKKTESSSNSRQWRINILPSAGHAFIQISLTLSHSIPSTWYHLITPPVKNLGCCAGTGWPFTVLSGSSICLLFSRKVSDSRPLISELVSLIFSISSASSFTDEWASFRKEIKTSIKSIMLNNYIIKYYNNSLYFKMLLKG